MKILSIESNSFVLQENTELSKSYKYCFRCTFIFLNWMLTTTGTSHASALTENPLSHLYIKLYCGKTWSAMFVFVCLFFVICFVFSFHYFQLVVST